MEKLVPCAQPWRTIASRNKPSDIDRLLGTSGANRTPDTVALVRPAHGFARRQMTWFRRLQGAVCLAVPADEAPSETARRILSHCRIDPAIPRRTEGKTERVFLVGAELKQANTFDVNDRWRNWPSWPPRRATIGEGTQKLDRPHVATFIGKAGEFAELAEQGEVDTVIFDEELSPAQTRNLERIFDCKVLDRTALILDIFAQRARAEQDADRDGATRASCRD